MSKLDLSVYEGKDGAFVRRPSSFRNFISNDPANPYQPEANRYHLYVAWACPWAHRVLTMIALRGLEDVISVSYVGALLDNNGWGFSEKSSLGIEGGTVDHIFGFEYIKQVYFKTEEHYDGRCTVPVLFDKKTEYIVNNESSEIILMLNSVFNEFAKYPDHDYYPDDLKEEIDEINEWILADINNGVYKTGFATKQEPHEDAWNALFKGLDRVEDILSKKRYLTGDRITLADVRLWPSLIRFDQVYHVHFKCNKKKIIEYPNIWGYLLEMYQLPGLANTVNFEQNLTHYYGSHESINPHGIIPKGPAYDYNQPHGRDKLSGGISQKLLVLGFLGLTTALSIAGYKFFVDKNIDQNTTI